MMDITSKPKDVNNPEKPLLVTIPRPELKAFAFCADRGYLPTEFYDGILEADAATSAYEITNKALRALLDAWLGGDEAFGACLGPSASNAVHSLVFIAHERFPEEAK